MTIHNTDDDNNILNKNNNQNIDKESLDKFIEEGLKDFYNLNNILKNKNFNGLQILAKQILDKYKQINFVAIDLSLLDSNHFLEFHYLLSLKSFFIHLILMICEIIIGLIDLYTKIIIPSLNDISKKTILKDILFKTLNKFEIFKFYVDSFNTLNFNEENIENLKIFKKDLSYKEKAYYLSCILTIILMSPKVDKNNYIEFFEIKDNSNDIYSKAKKFIFSIINKLKSESAYLNGLELTTSKIKKDLNEYNYKNYKKDNNKNTFILEMRTIDELKKTIKGLFPKLIVRTYNSKSGFISLIDMFSGLMIINENLFEKNNFEKILGAYDDSESLKKIDKVIQGLIDLNIKENYELYNLYIFKAFWRINHECFGHLPVLEINNKKCDTPKKFFAKEYILKVMMQEKF